MQVIESKLYNLIEQGDSNNLQLACYLVKSLGYQVTHLEKLIEKITSSLLEEFLPNMDYHRFGCSVLEKNTFNFVYNRLNEFLQVPYLQVIVCADFIQLKTYILVDPPKEGLKVIEISLEELSSALYYTVKAEFEIGERPTS